MKKNPLATVTASPVDLGALKETWVENSLIQKDNLDRVTTQIGAIVENVADQFMELLV